MRYNIHMMNIKDDISSKKRFCKTTILQQKTAHRVKLIGSAVFCVLFFMLAAAAAYVAPNIFLEEKSGYVHVRGDMTAAEVADELYENGYISHPVLFRLAATITGKGHQIQEGEYVLDTSMSLRDILEKLVCGKSEALRLVIPEGYTVWRIAQTVASLSGKVSEEEFLQAAKNEELLYPYMKSHHTVTFAAEGFLFPDTYFIPVNASAEDIIRMMVKNFDDHVTDEMKKEINGKNLSIYQFVILASLIEKEAKYAEDRPLIASVFLNRLNRRMKLQSDASISYAMGTHKAAYSIAETQYASPYNTYVYEGLPAGPIGNPGMECMEAILHAPETSYFYFVADQDGNNYFAVTYEDHLKNVEEHLP